MKKHYQSPDMKSERLEVINLICLSVQGNSGLTGGGPSDEEARGREFDDWDGDY